MRPQDIVVLFKIIAKGNIPWQNKDLAAALYISPAEISASLDRSMVAGLINTERKKVHKQTFMEFLQYGLHVVFPVVPGGVVNGMYTAHAHPFMQQSFPSNEAYVWPDVTGSGRGQSITPLYRQAVKAAADDELLYKMLALADVIRVGKVREIHIAIDVLKKIIHEPSY